MYEFRLEFHSLKFVPKVRISNIPVFVSRLTAIGPENGLSPRPLQAIIWTNDG